MTDKEFKAIRKKVNEMKKPLKAIDEEGNLDSDNEVRLTRALREMARDVDSMTTNVLNRVLNTQYYGE